MTLDRKIPAFICMASTRTVKTVVATLEQHEGFVVEADYKVGTVTVTEGDQVVYRALRKGKDGPWIVVGHDGPSITWTKPSALS